MEEETCWWCYGSGKSPFSALGLPCSVCGGTGVAPNEDVEEEEEEELDNKDYIQNSFEQHGPLEPEGEPHIKMDMNGISFKDKEGNWTEPITHLSTPIDFINITINLEGGKTITGGEGIMMPMNEEAKNKSKGMFEQFMEAIEAEQAGRTPMRYLTVWSVEELLDLYNDYKQLYDMFKDEEYLLYMKDILKVLKAKTKK